MPVHHVLASTRWARTLARAATRTIAGTTGGGARARRVPRSRFRKPRKSLLPEAMFVCVREPNFITPGPRYEAPWKG